MTEIKDQLEGIKGCERRNIHEALEIQSIRLHKGNFSLGASADYKCLFVDLSLNKFLKNPVNNFSFAENKHLLSLNEIQTVIQSDPICISVC